MATITADNFATASADSHECYVYVIGIVIEKTPLALSKIGVSHSPKSRLCSLQSASPFEMALVHSFKFQKRDMALHYESLVHDFFQKERMRGEWFNILPLEIVDYIAEDLYTFVARNFGNRGDDVVKKMADLVGLTKAFEILAGAP